MVQLMYIYWDLIKQKSNYPTSCDHTPGADKTSSLENGNVNNGMLVPVYWDLIKQKINYHTRCHHTPGADKTESLMTIYILGFN